MINGFARTAIPRVSKWRGLSLIVNETVPVDGYVITDRKGKILGGGNIKTGKMWRKEEGEPARIYAPEPVARELIATEHDIDPSKELH